MRRELRPLRGFSGKMTLKKTSFGFVNREFYLRNVKERKQMKKLVNFEDGIAFHGNTERIAKVLEFDYL